MLVAVENFGKESEEAKAGGEATTETTATTETRATTETKPASRTVKVSETEFKIKLPESSLPAGSYSFDVENDGKIPHDLVVKGQGVDEATKTIDAGVGVAVRRPEAGHLRPLTAPSRATRRLGWT